MGQLEASELARLHAIIRQWRPVIEAAKAWRHHYFVGGTMDDYQAVQDALENAVDALEALEAKEE